MSGRVREEFRKRGHDAWSCDLKPTLIPGQHYQGNLLDILYDHWDLGIFFPDCTYNTVSAEWAYGDPDYERFPEVGYHQRVLPGTLTGAARREARRESLDFVRLLMSANINKIAIENPVGAISSQIRQPDQIIQPYNFCADASKKTCLWLKNLKKLVPTHRVQGRWIYDSKRGFVERWGNQTDSGQNRLGPKEGRDEERSLTYPGIARCMAMTWG